MMEAGVSVNNPGTTPVGPVNLKTTVSGAVAVIEATSDFSTAPVPALSR